MKVIKQLLFTLPTMIEKFEAPFNGIIINDKCKIILTKEYSSSSAKKNISLAT